MPHHNMEFRGNGGAYFVTFLWTGLVTVITFYIFAPWAYCIIQKQIARDTFIEGKQLDFVGTGGSAFVMFLIVGILSMITFGIYAPWGFCKIQAWKWENIRFMEGGAPVA
ncbi:MAG: hypothetical protein Kow0090_19060 [Myxococcota bacterium]